MHACTTLTESDVYANLFITIRLSLEPAHASACSLKSTSNDVCRSMQVLTQNKLHTIQASYRHHLTKALDFQTNSYIPVLNTPRSLRAGGEYVYTVPNNNKPTLQIRMITFVHTK